MGDGGEPIFFEGQADFRAWMEEHHATAGEVFVGFHRKASGRGGLAYREALDEALCFGWIDGVRHKHDEASYKQRFTPRRKGSKWSKVNLARFAELRDKGLVAPAGAAAFEAYDGSPTGYSFEAEQVPLAPGYLARLQANEAAWAYWESRPPGYRRTATHWVMSAKQEATRERRLAALIADSEAGRAISLLRRTTTTADGA